jgi:CIC family chloride channel protein
MGTAFAGIVRTPWTSVIMIFEITRDYTIIVPLMISNMIAFFISQKLQKEPIYEALSHQEGIHLPTAESRIHDDRMQVEQAMRLNPLVFSPDAELSTILDQVRAGAFNAWPVVGEQGLQGMILNAEIEKFVAAGDAHKKLSEVFCGAGDLALSGGHVHPDQSLSLAMERMGTNHVNVLPVVSRANVRQLVGIVALEDILNTYGFPKRGGG